jgi:hypothetical protein
MRIESDRKPRHEKQFSKTLLEGLKSLIEDEDKSKPLTDEDIAKTLNLSRSHISNARKELGIPKSKVRGVNVPPKRPKGMSKLDEFGPDWVQQKFNEGLTREDIAKLANVTINTVSDYTIEQNLSGHRDFLHGQAVAHPKDEEFFQMIRDGLAQNYINLKETYAKVTGHCEGYMTVRQERYPEFEKALNEAIREGEANLDKRFFEAVKSGLTIKDATKLVGKDQQWAISRKNKFSEFETKLKQAINNREATNECRECGEKFPTPPSGQPTFFCCEECGELYWKEWHKEYNKENREKLSQQHRDNKLNWTEEQWERDRESKRQWSYRNPDKQAANLAKRRAKLKEALLPSSDKKLMEEYYTSSRYLTELTGIKHHVDHTIAIAIGGAHHQDNLEVMTAMENYRKNDTYDPEKYPKQLTAPWADNDLAREYKKKHNIECELNLK